MRFRLVVDGEAREIEIKRRQNTATVRVDGVDYRTESKMSKGEVVVRVGTTKHRIRFVGSSVFIDGQPHKLSVPEVGEEREGKGRPFGGRKPASLEVRSPMPGRVVHVSVTEGARVKRGDTLAILEAMKMRNEIPAPADGTVREVRVTEGESITADRVVAVLAVH